MIPVPIDSPIRRVPFRATRYRHFVPNRVYMLVQSGRYKHGPCRNHLSFPCAVDDEHIYTFDLWAAILAVYAEWPQAGRKKLNLLIDTVGDLWYYERHHSATEVYLTLLTLDI